MRRLVAAASACLLVAGGITSAVAATTSWSIDGVRTPPVANATLAATSCPVVTFCVAVGSTTDGSGAESTLVESSPGTSQWTRVPSPNPSGADDATLRGVSCTSPTNCVAVGEWVVGGRQRSLIERWDGSVWRFVTHPQPATRHSDLRSVSCVGSSFCIAVGDAQATTTSRTTLVEQWDGAAWSIVATPAVGSVYSALLDVDCSSANWCAAVGNAGSADTDREGAYLAVIETFNGTAWHVKTQSDGDIGTLHGVSCTSRTWCMAVGRRYSFTGGDFPTAETWNGSTWTLRPVPTDAQRLDGVSCTTTTFCALVGIASHPQGSYAATWDGASVVSTPSPATVDLVDTSCATATSCVAVGAASRATIQRFDGAHWTLETAVDGRGDTGSELTAVSCVSDTFCISVGDYVDAAAVTDPLIERWNGTRWQAMDAPRPAGHRLARLLSVSCVSASWCVASGHRATTLGAFSTLLEIWNGATWTIAAAPDRGSVSSVSCVSADFCVAAAVRATEFWDGSTWTAVPVSGPGGADVALNGIDCVSTDNCVLVGGYYGSYPDLEPTLVERWNGSTWSVEPSPTGPSAHFNELFGVSCASASFCVAVGSSHGTEETPLIFTADGSGWTDTPHPSSAQPFRAVSCAVSGSCVAVGTGRLVQTLSGGTWTRDATPAPAGALGAPSYYGVDCQSATACRIVGSYHRLAGTFALALSRS